MYRLFVRRADQRDSLEIFKFVYVKRFPLKLSHYIRVVLRFSPRYELYKRTKTRSRHQSPGYGGDYD
jgi:hypothetical protein